MDHMPTVNRLAAAQTLDDLDDRAVLSEIVANLLDEHPNVGRATALAMAWHIARARVQN